MRNNGLQNCPQSSHSSSKPREPIYRAPKHAAKNMGILPHVLMYLEANVSAQLIKINLKIYFRALCHVFYNISLHGYWFIHIVLCGC